MTAPSAPADSSSAPAADPAGGDALMRAFLQGAGIADVSVNWEVTPAFMELLGNLLAASVDGTFDLLSARARLKRDLDNETTMVVVRNNNPLKFLDESKIVLTQMLRKKMPGFMGPVEALADAFDDLKSHHDCMAAGTQGVIGDVLRRIDPQALEAAAPAPGLLDRLVPARRDAALWRQYRAAHARLREQAGEDKTALGSAFASAFTNAYERRLEQLRDEADHG